MYLCEYFFDSIAILANIILMTIPVWWQMSLYGHPQQIAVFFNFVGLALLCYRPRPAAGTLARVKALAVDLLIVAAFSLCLMNRLDCILMFPLIPAILICEWYSVKSFVVRFAGYTLIPILAFFSIDSYLPSTDIPAGSSIGNTFKLLFRWHNPSRLVEHFGEANRIFLSAYPGFLLIAFILACFYLLHRRKFIPLFFILPVVLINYFFWLPSPFPARHFVYLAPALSIGIAILLASIGEQTSLFFSTSKLKTYIGVFLVFLTGHLCTSLMDGVPVYRGVYSPEDAIAAGRLGEDLMKIPPENQPVYVVSDAIPVIVKMQLISNSIKISKSDHHSLLVNNGKNDFIFCVQGWDRKSVSDLQEEAAKCHKMRWLVDPYNKFIYSKMKDFKPASTHSKAP
jgi:hypothetical protein